MYKRVSVPVFVFICLFLSVKIGLAQDSTKVYPKTLDGQYREMMDKSNHFQDYKVVKQTRLANFRKSALDTINRERRRIAELKQKLTAQTQTVSGLKNNLDSKDKTLAESKAKVDEISFLGIPFSKGSYSTMMWGIVFVLAAVLAFIFFQSTSYRREAKYRIKLFDELSEEYRLFKTKANDKEKKLARELQDERNKLEELSGRY